jgi:transcriptional regulator of acetoin/glycerol metabolism
MVNNNIAEELLELYKSFGKEGIEKIYSILGNNRFTLKPLLDHIKTEQVLKDFTTTNKSITRIALDNKLNRRTVYRTLKKFKAKK